MKPNIIVFMTDQQNASTIKADSIAKTPNLDEFIKKSTYFTDSYCPSPHCCPCRATFFSGLYPSQHGVWNNVEVDNALSRGLYDGLTLFPEVLRDGGYNTYFSGKWHVSALEGPGDRGFNKVAREVISNFGRIKNPNVPTRCEWNLIDSKPERANKGNEKKEPGRIIKEGYPSFYTFGTDENPFGDTTTVDVACKEINEYKEDKPLFMYVGTTGPHDPYFPPQEFIDMYDINDIKLPENFKDDMMDKPALYRRTKDQYDLSEQEHKQAILNYLAFVTYEDYLFGKLLKCINDKGIADNTIIIYLTDHGDYMGAHGLWAKGLPCFKEAYNICAVVGGAGIAKGKTVDSLVSLADFAPTIIELAGLENPVKMTGKSLVGFLHNDDPKDWRTEMFTQTNGNEVYGIQRAVWNKKWKYVYDSFDYDELYDLEKDPLELHNVAKCAKNKAVIRDMCKKMWKFGYSTNDACNCGYIMVRLAPYGPGIINEDK